MAKNTKKDIKKDTKKDLKRAQKWIDLNATGYKKLYGPKWEIEINRDAWAKFGEHKGRKTLKESLEELEQVRMAFNVIKKNLENVRTNTTNKSLDINRLVRRILHTDLQELEKDINNIMKEMERRKAMNYKEGRNMRLGNFSGKKAITEHDDPSSYINNWKDKGYSIDTQRGSDGLTFNVTDPNGRSFSINEPTTGSYAYKGQSFGSFDDAMMAASSPDLSNNTDMKEAGGVSPEDEFVFENVRPVTIDRLRDLAGIVKAVKVPLKENFSEIPTMTMTRAPTQMSRLMEKLAAIAESADKEDEEKIDESCQCEDKEGEEHDELVEGNSKEAAAKSNEQANGKDEENCEEIVKDKKVPLKENFQEFVKLFHTFIGLRTNAGYHAESNPAVAEEAKQEARILFMQIKNTISTFDIPKEDKTDLVAKLVNAASNAYDQGVAISGGDRAEAKELQSRNSEILSGLKAMVTQGYGADAPIQEAGFDNKPFSNEYKNNKGGSLTRPVSLSTQDYDYHTEIDDYDDDSRKKDHYLTNKRTGEKKRVDWSPYADMDAADIANYIKAGMPDRVTDKRNNTSGPWNKKSLARHLAIRDRKRKHLTKMGALKDRRPQPRKP